MPELKALEVRLWHLADNLAASCLSAFGPKRTKGGADAEWLGR